MTMKMKRQEVCAESRDVQSTLEQRSTEDTDFVDPRGDKYFRFVRTKKGSVDSRLGCNEARQLQRRAKRLHGIRG